MIIDSVAVKFSSIIYCSGYNYRENTPNFSGIKQQ